MIELTFVLLLTEKAKNLGDERENGALEHLDRANHAISSPMRISRINFENSFVSREKVNLL